MKARNILFISPFSHIGGAELSLLGVLERLDRSRWQPQVLCYQQGTLIERINALGIPVQVTERTGLWSQLRIIAGIIALVRTQRISLVHVNTLDIRAGLACWLAGVPFVGHLRVIFPFTWRDRLFVRLADMTVAVSRAAASAFCFRHPGLFCRFRVVPNAVFADAPVVPADVRSEYAFPDDAPLVCAVGRIDPLKGFEYFIQAAALIAQRCPAARFLIVGAPTPGSVEEQAYLGKLRGQVSRSGLNGRVVFTGFRKDVLQVLAACDVAVVPSVNIERPAGSGVEGFGRVAVEAMAAGVPVVASAVGGLTEIIEDGRSGLLVPQKDPAAICAKVVSILTDPGVAKALKEQGRRRFESYYSASKHMQALADVYKQVFSARAAFSRQLGAVQRIKAVVRCAYFLLRLPLIVLLRLLLRPHKDTGEVSRILVIRIDRLGDFILSLPVIDNLKLRYPSARIDVLVAKNIKDLALMVKGIDTVLVHESLGTSMKRVAATRYDIAVDLLGDWRMDSALLCLASRAPVRLGFAWGFRQIFFTHAVGWGLCSRLHLCDAHCALLAAIGVDPVVRVPVLGIGRSPKEDLIVFAPGGTYPSQRWPLERFISLGTMILAHYPHRIVVSGSARELGLINSIVSGIADPRAEMFAGELKELVDLINRSRLVVCNNSGPLHVAAALGVPTVSTLGPTDDVRFAPLGSDDSVISRKLPCQPCFKDRCSDLNCLKLISAEEMFDAVKRHLDKGKQ